MNWELRMILVTLLAAAVSAAPANLVNSAVPYAHEVAAPAYAAAPVLRPSVLTYAVPEPVAVAVQPKITYDFPAQIAKLAPTPVKVEYDILGPIAAPAPAPIIRVAAPVKVEYIILPARIPPAPVAYAAPAPIVQVAAPVKVEYDFPAPISAPAPVPVAVAAPAPVAYAAPAPVAYAAPAPVAYAAPAPVANAAPALVAYAAPAPVHVVPQAFETRVHYADTKNPNVIYFILGQLSKSKGHQRQGVEMRTKANSKNGISRRNSIPGAFLVPAKVNGAFAGPLAVVPAHYGGPGAVTNSAATGAQYLPIIDGPNWPFLGRPKVSSFGVDPQPYSSAGSAQYVPVPDGPNWPYIGDASPIADLHVQ